VPPRIPPLGRWEYTAIAVFFTASVYTGWVAWDVHDAKSDTVAASGGGSPSPSSSVEVAAPDSPVTPPPLRPFRLAARSASTVLVIGDSTGAGSGAWVDLVAQDLGDQRQVAVHEWDETSGQFGEVPTSYGETGPRLDVWNLSYHGVEPDYAEHLDAVPAPDVVLLDIGHDRGPRELARAATATLDGVGARWGDVPTAVVLQNPSVLDQEAQQRRGVRRLTRFAAEYGDPVIDVYAAFEQADPGLAFVTADSRPTDDGSRLWADVVDRALGVTTSR
jgi:hypothetical protein